MIAINIMIIIIIVVVVTMCLLTLNLELLNSFQIYLQEVPYPSDWFLYLHLINK